MTIPDTVTSVASYSATNELRAQLITLTEELRAHAEGLEDATRRGELERLAERLRSDAFRIMFCGEFSRGKSTLINAMLGRKVLPTWATPTTAIINEVRWGESPKAFVYHRDASDVPIAVDVDELATYVTVDEEDEDAPSPYQRAIVEWPLELCRKGVHCIDSPGLNAHLLHDEITTDYLQITDVVVFVFDCTAALGRSEQIFLQTRVIASGAQDLFFVGNKINLVDEPEDRVRVERKVNSTLSGLLGEPPKLFFVNAKGALQARMAGDHAAGDSNLGAMEAALEQYLTSEPGRRRLARTSRVLQTTAEDLRHLAQTRLDMLAVDRADLRRRYEEQTEPLETLERKRDLILTRVVNHMTEIERTASQMAGNLLRRIADDIPEWAADFEPETRVSANPLRMKAKIDERVQQLIAHLDERVQLEFAKWQESELLATVENRLTVMGNEIGNSIDDFMAQIDDVRYELTLKPTKFVDADGAEVEGRERILAAAAGLLLTGAGGVVEGGMFGFKGLIRSILPSLAASIGLILLHFSPLAIFAVLIGLGAGRSIFKLKAVNEKVKTDVASSVADELRHSATERGHELGEVVRKKLGEVENALQSALEGQILDLRREVELVLNERDTSERDAAMRDATLRSSIEDLNHLSRRTGDIFHDLAR